MMNSTPAKAILVHSLKVLVSASALALASNAMASVDIAGHWQSFRHEERLVRGDGPDLGDYTGLPINAAARQKAESWDATVLSLPERQTTPHPVTYAMNGPRPDLRIEEIIDPETQMLKAYRISGLYQRADERTIWMDGRPHPSPLAEHTWTGFSTGHWEGNVLVVKTTHIKMGFIQRNGVPSSPYATLEEHFVRHRDQLMSMFIVTDPVYLDEPLVRTANWKWSPTLRIAARTRAEPAEEFGVIDRGHVPHWPLGTVHDEFGKRFGIPLDATFGGAYTMYPEYTRSPAAIPVAPAKVSGVPLPPQPLEVLHVQGNVHVLAGGGALITVQSGEDGLLLVDSGDGTKNDAVQGELRKVSTARVNHIINTSSGARHIGGNAALAADEPEKKTLPDGSTGGSLAQQKAFIMRGEGAVIRSHENAATEMGRVVPGTAPVDRALMPNRTFFTERQLFAYNDEPIEMIHVPNAITTGDVIVLFRKSDVISTGDLFSSVSYPVIDPKRGGSLKGVLEGLNMVIDIAVPKINQEAGTRIIPAYGRICNEMDVVEYRDMLTIIRDRIDGMVKKGMTLQQVKNARPTLDYDGIYDHPVPGTDWGADKFIEAAYLELRGKGRR
jgi:glyoxylase-like metal-dependent hydrolase (beta-lactamase superfamily II)